MKVLKINKSTEQGVQDLLKFLLESGKVKGVLTLRKISENGGIAYSLVTNPDMLKDALPLFPFMPTNAGKLLSHLTLKGEVKEPIAAVVRPCELRAFVELVKRQKGVLENILIISSTCGGVYPNEMVVNGKLNDDVSQYWSAIKEGIIAADIRPACKGCEHFVPSEVDMTVALIGRDDIDKQCTIFLGTDKGEEFANGMGGEILEEELGDMEPYKTKRDGEKKKRFDEIGIESFGMDGLINIFGRCIGCRGCRAVCPICYCQLCTFDTQDSEYKPSTWEKEIKAKGGLRTPPNTVYYHIGRLAHVSISCVGCGSCDDACPVDIPLSSIYKKVGESIQEMFDYLPGRDVKEDIPLKTFEIEELSDIEN